MNEEEWLTFCKLDFVSETGCLGRGLSVRKCRLFAIACCRRIWSYIPNEESRQIIDALERVTDAVSTETEWKAACQTYERYHEESYASAPNSQAEAYAKTAVATCFVDTHRRLSYGTARYCSKTVMADSTGEDTADRGKAEERAQCDLIRDIFGNPFRPIAFDPAWRTTDVLLLAKGIYEERAFDRMPILADALQDAGCGSDDILGHLRDPQAAHVRGCWTLDLVLGKE